MTDQQVASLWFAVSAAVMFAVLTALVVAVLFGPSRGPGFIRRASWMLSWPTNVVAWIGLTIAAAIAISTQLLMLFLLSGGAGRPDLVSGTIAVTEMGVAAGWLAYLGWLYTRPARSR